MSEQSAIGKISRDISIRPAKLDERDALEALQWRASLMWPEDRDSLIEHPDAIVLPAEHISDGRTLVAQRKNEVVGFAVVLPRADGNAELDGLFVDPKAWRVGIGRFLVKEAERLARADGASFLYVIGNPRAEGFYAACGFELKGHVETRFGLGLIMRKTLRILGALTNREESENFRAV